MRTAEEFYELRDRPTREYCGWNIESRPVHVEIDEASCESPAGQLLLLALANQLVRVHRVVTFAIPTPAAKPISARTPARNKLANIGGL